MDVEVEVVPLGPTPLQHAPMDASFTEDHDKKDEDNPPSNQAPHPTQASSFRLKHATDPSKFKPVEVPSDGASKQSPKNAFQTFRKNLDAFSRKISMKKPANSTGSTTGFQSSRSLDQERSTDPVDGTETPEAVPSTSQSHIYLHKKLSKGFSAQITSIFRGAGNNSKKSKSTPKLEAGTSDKETESKMGGQENNTPKISFTEPNRYFIEHYKDLKEPLLFGDEQNASMRHGVLISKCENVVINITKKVNKVEIDHCKNVTVHMPAVIAACDIQHSDSCTVVVAQRCPGLSICNCQSLSVYIPRDNMEGLEVASSGDGSANILVPTVEDPSEHTEFPVPFHFLHHFKGDKLVSEVSPLYTH